MTLSAVFRPGQGMSMEHLTTTDPAPGHVSVRIEASGVCHSDLHIVNGDWPTEQPLVLGHEAAGVVTAVGDGVTEAREGDHVILSWFAPCRRCTNCAAGRAWLCTGTAALNNSLPDGSTPFTDDSDNPVYPYLGLGTWGPSVVVPESAVVTVNSELPYAVGALIGCSVTTGVGAVLNTARVEPGSSALVAGCGGVGLSIVMGLHLAGATTVIAVDVSDEKLAQARALGATHTVNTSTEDLADIVARLGGVDYAFEAIGKPSVIETLPPLVHAGGTVVLAGMTPIGARVSIDPFDLADQGKSIVGCNYGSSIASIDIPRLTELYLRGRLPIDQLIGKTRPMSEAAAALDDLAAGVGLRTVLLPEA